VSSLIDRSIIVTGGASGIGLAAGLLAARRGALVTLGDANENLLGEAVAGAQKENLPVVGKVTDVTSEASIEGLLDAALQAHGRLDGIVCSAGTTALRWAVDLQLSEWERVLAVNLTGTFLSARATARRMIGAGRGGSIVTVASMLGITGQKQGAHYSASKAGIIGLTKSLALEFSRYGIRVNCVAPGPTDTPLLRDTMGGDALDKTVAAIPLGRLGTPQDLAQSICFLLSDESSWVTGETFHVNGGTLMA
jgi:NAD(P)-dependent dehydrogenase (short-subunit alcohol dehydrogenase family)